jgi:hypothetical protein
MRAMSTTPITDGIHQALNHAVEAEMDVDEGWISSKPAERPLEDGVLGYIRGYPVKPLKYGQGWTIIYRETQTTDKKRMN